MRRLGDSCLALFKPQNVKWIAFGNVIFLVMMIKVLTYNPKYTTGHIGPFSKTNYTEAEFTRLQKEFQEATENGDKAKGISLWRQLLGGNEWFSFRMPPAMENGDDVVQFFRPPGSVKVRSDKKQKHCDLCIGGKPKTPITSSAFLQMYKQQCEKETANITDVNLTMPLCPCLPKALLGRQSINVSHNSSRSNTTLIRELRPVNVQSEMQPGGYWKPLDCYSRDRVAIIIPFRDRQSHLNILLKYLHPLLQRQLIEYRIFVVEQATPHVFNKAAIMNVGFLEAKTIFNFDCVVFHDVDMIPEDDRNFYTCMNSPRHVAPYLNKWNYTLGYLYLIGGALLLKPHQFEAVNGFSNQFYGWGGEDDDMYKRLETGRIEIFRYPSSVACYTMIQHERDKGNPYNRHASASLNVPKGHYKKDGINNIHYYIRAIENKPRFTWIYVELPESKKS